MEGVHSPLEQTPGVPPPPQDWPAGQLPQPPAIKLPQPSPAGPQDRCCAAQVCGTQAPESGAPQVPGLPPPPQVCPLGQLPQPPAIKLPQPSPAGPHERCCSAQVRGTHTPPSGVPQTPGVPPPPHVSPVGHEPQSSALPQPSLLGPHVSPSAAHVLGAQWLGGGSTQDARSKSMYSRTFS